MTISAISQKARLYLRNRRHDQTKQASKKWFLDQLWTEKHLRNLP